MLAADWELCTRMASEQIREGAHVLDVCVDYVGRDGACDMDEIAARSPPSHQRPLVLDSTEPRCSKRPPVIGGRAILKSANLEEG